MKRLSEIQVNMELEILGLSSPQIVKVMNEAKAHPNKIIRVEDGDVKIMYRRGDWFFEEE